MQLELYRHCIVVRQYRTNEYADRQVVRVKYVSPIDVATAFARELALSTPLLPPETIWWAKTPIGSRTLVYRPAQVREIALHSYGQPLRKYKLPWPPLVFLASDGGHTPYVFAVIERPKDDKATLYNCPAFNVFPSGKICVGGHRFPTDPGRIPEAFFESYFSPAMDTAGGKSRKFPNIQDAWNAYDGLAEYPLDDLYPFRNLTIADLARINL